jgi:hypothetical protein
MRKGIEAGAAMVSANPAVTQSAKGEVLAHHVNHGVVDADTA